MKSLESLPPLQGAMLELLKRGRWTLVEMAKRLKVTFEAVRKQVRVLEREGWVVKAIERGPGAGRPASRYALSPAGEHLFPKSYDALTNELIEHVVDRHGPAAVHEVLESLTAARIRAFAPRVEGKPLREKVLELRAIYQADDPYVSVEQSPDGFRLIERNCPFLNVASRHPVLCSVTVSALSRLLGVRVLREERFQHGDGRCVFRILEEEPLPVSAASFEIEPEAERRAAP